MFYQLNIFWSRNGPYRCGNTKKALTQRYVGGIPQGYFNCSPMKRFQHAKSIGGALL